MATLKPNEFIDAVFIRDLSDIMAINKPYISFMVMAIGIEYLGKCISPSQNWEEERVSRIRFEEAIKTLPAFSTYVKLLKDEGDYDLYRTLRCGLAHSARPKRGITLSSKDEATHMFVHENGAINLRCEDFFSDFISACQEVQQREFNDPEDKMNKPFLAVPDDHPPVHQQVTVASGSTMGGPINIIISSKGI